jgi:hypothetical protein
LLNGCVDEKVNRQRNSGQCLSTLLSKEGRKLKRQQVSTAQGMMELPIDSGYGRGRLWRRGNAERDTPPFGGPGRKQAQVSQTQ